MLPYLAPGARYTDELADRVHRVADDASNVRTGGTLGIEGYLSWANESARQLAWQLSTAEIERLVLTPTYWRIQTLTTAPAYQNQVIDRELIAATEALNAARDAIRSAVHAWPSSDYVIVPDTNVMLQGNNGEIMSVDWHSLTDLASNENLVVVLLQAVIDELDKHKRSGNRAVAKLAKKALREIDATFTRLARGPVQLSHEMLLPDHAISGSNVYLMAVVDSLAHRRLADADSEIIDRALALRARSSAEVVFLTGDTGAALRAKAAGLRVAKIPTPDADAG